MHMKRLVAFVATTMVAASMGVVLLERPVVAAGSPDVTISKDMPGTTLYGASTPVTLTASNPTGTDGFNLSFNDVLPPGTSLVSADPAPTTSFTDGSGNLVLIWENVADLQAGTSFSVSYEFLAGPGAYAVGDSVANSAGAYVNTDPRLVPDFDPATGAATGDFTGSDTTTAATDLVPFVLGKSEPARDAELLRGVHDHQTLYTLTVDNNLIDPTNGFQVEDYLPAGLEFLECGSVDNTTVGEEYPGSGPINPGNAPVPVNPCPTASTVETISIDPDGAGPMPSGIYTHVVWSAADLLAALGSADLSAGASFSIDYVAGIPLRENELFVGGTPTTGVQGANLDNNTGSLTSDEQGIQNLAVASGTYTGDGNSYSDSAIEGVTAEDVALHKSVDTDVIVQTGVSTWTLDVETSEYATDTFGITVTDTLPDGLCPVAAGTPCSGAGAAPNPIPASVAENGDGTWTLVWNLPDLPAPSSTATITFRSVAEDSYTSGGGPVASNDSWSNTAALSSTSAVITDNDGSTTDLGIPDDASAGQAAGGVTITKSVSVPATPLTCGTGTGLGWDTTESGDYRPGDRVCWKLEIDFPSLLDTIDVQVRDYLPAGFAFESASFGDNHDATGFAFDGSAPVPTWSTTGVDIGGQKFEAILSSLITDPEAAGEGDILANLMKVTYENSAGSVFQMRDQADATWAEPELSLVKGVTHVDGVGVPGAPADGIEIQGGDVVSYAVVVDNDGSIDADAVSIRDVLPTGITCAEVGSVSPGGACDGANLWIQWDAITVSAGGSMSLSYDVTYPADIGAGESFTNNAGVRSYQSDTNRTAPDDTFMYVPSSNIDPTMEPTANVPPIDDPSDVFAASPSIAKARTTSISESGNAGSNQATIGETITYTVTVVIPEGTTLHGGATLTDSISTRLTHVAGTASVTLNGAGLPGGFGFTDSAGSISVTFPDPYTNAADSGDDTLQVVFDAVVDDEAANDRVTGATVPNSSTLSWDDSEGDPSSINAAVNTTVVEPNLAITKADDDADGVVDPGQSVDYTITATNTAGSRVSTAHDIVIIDTIPPNLTPQLPIADGGTWDSGARTITWTVPSMAPGASVARTYTAVVVDPLVGSTVLTNTAVVTGSSMSGSVPGERDAASPNGGEGSGYQSTAQNQVTAPNLATSKGVSPASATVGELVTYTLDVTIPADIVLYDATIIDDIPVGIVYDGTISSSCDQSGLACSPAISVAEIGSDGDLIGWFLGDLDPDADDDRVVTITYQAYLDDVVQVADGATLTNTANVHGNQANDIAGVPGSVPDPSTFDTSGTADTADLDVVEPTLTVDKDVAGQVGDTDTRRARPGDLLTYTLTIENTGSSPAHDIVVVDTPDARMELGTVADGAGYSVTDGDPSDATLGWSIAGPVAAGDSVVITYELAVPAGLDEADEVDPGAEIMNTADVPSYWGVSSGNQQIGYPYREYDDVSPDTVGIELDLGSIGDRVWFDIDRDGVLDAGEPPLSGIDVVVTFAGADNTLGTGDDEVFPATTNASGVYLVEDLPGGTYRVQVDSGDIPPGYAASYDLDDGLVAPDGTWIGVLGEDESKLDVDFGYTGTGSIGDTVWFDRDGDGLVGADEPGLGSVDVAVIWLGADGVAGGGDDVVYSTTTNAAGAYAVGSLPPGNFEVVIDDTDLPSGFQPVFDADGTLDNRTAVTLGAGETFVTADFGYRGGGSIGDTIWLDTDSDGLVDAGEVGLEGVIVEVTWFGPDGVAGGGDDATFADTTDVDGQYLVDGLPAGSYEVLVTGGLPGGVSNTYDEDGNQDSAAPVTLVVNDDHLGADFGYAGVTSLGDRVWWDLSADGVQDPGEPGLGGVEVAATFAGADDIFGNADDEVFVTLTDGSGDYLFAGLADGDYRVAVTGGVDAGMVNTFDEDDGIIAPDASTLVAGLIATAHLTADFGYVGSGRIGDTLWFDVDGDGLVDGAEPGIPGVTVTLTWYGPDGVAGGDDDVQLTTVTDADGMYGFDGLPAGRFDITVDETTLPPGLEATFDLDGGFDGGAQLSLADGEVRDDADFGYTGTGSIGDTVWLDLDGDGAQSAGEPGIPGVDVIVTWAGLDGILGTGDDVTYTDITDGDGEYRIGRLPAGDCQVQVSGMPSGVTQSGDPDGGNDDRSLLTLGAGADDLDQDFGYVGSATVGDLIWLDVVDNGRLDAGEPGLSGITVTVTSAGVDGVLGTNDDIVIATVTDADGGYVVAGLPTGETSVSYARDDLPAGVVPSGDLDGGDPSATTVVLASEESNLDVDYPVVGTATLEGVVWYDEDRDGFRDAGEEPIGGVTVTVTWHGPEGPVDMEVITDTDGSWVLDDLPAGDYTAATDRSTVPEGLVPSTPESLEVAVPPGGTGSVEHGLTDPATASIGSLVWIDRDRDGVVDADEPGIPGVWVSLVDEDGNVIASMPTGSDGSYLFEDLPPGTYTVRIHPDSIPDGLVPVGDRDTLPDFETRVTIDVGENVLDANFGFDDSDPSLPFTGIFVLELGAAGLLALISGLGLLWIARRRTV